MTATDARRAELERLAREVVSARQYTAPMVLALDLVDAILDADWQPPNRDAAPSGCGACCWCQNEHGRAVHARNPDAPLPYTAMVVCPVCECKRCPKATHHDHACTGSNAPGQAGSVYGDFKLDTSWLKEVVDGD